MRLKRPGTDVLNKSHVHLEVCVLSIQEYTSFAIERTYGVRYTERTSRLGSQYLKLGLNREEAPSCFHFLRRSWLVSGFRSEPNFMRDYVEVCHTDMTVGNELRPRSDGREARLGGGAYSAFAHVLGAYALHAKFGLRSCRHHPPALLCSPRPLESASRQGSHVGVGDILILRTGQGADG